MIFAHADRMRKRVAQKYLYRSGWLVAWLAARGAGWLASASRLACWLAGARIVYRLASGWLAGGRVAGWLALACVACAGVASGSQPGPPVE